MILLWSLVICPLLFIVVILFVPIKKNAVLSWLTLLSLLLNTLLLVFLYSPANSSVKPTISFFQSSFLQISIEINLLAWLLCFVCSLIWIVATLFSVHYFIHEKNSHLKRYQGFSLLNYWTILFIFLATNFFTFFIFF